VLTRTWEGCFSLLKSSLTSVGLLGPGMGGGGTGGRGGISEDETGMVKSGPVGGYAM
jgi:hypothetical protein